MRRALVAFGVGAAALFCVVLWANRTQDLYERLIVDARATYRPEKRRVHVDEPLDAGFGDLLKPLLPRLQAARDEYGKLPLRVHEDCTAVREGNLPFSALPIECSDDLEQHRPLVRALLEATHASRLEIPPELDTLRAESWRPANHGWPPVQYGAKLAALDIRAHLAAGQMTPEVQRYVVDECIDALALGREVSHSHALIGSMISAALVGLLTQSCAAVIDRVSSEEKERAAAGVLRIRQELRTFKAVLGDEAVFSELASSVSALNAAELDRLPVEAAALARAHPSTLSMWLRLLPGIGWRCTVQEHERLALAMALPPSQRERELFEVHDVTARSWNPLCREMTGDFSKLYVRHQNTLDRLELLVAAAHADLFFARTRRWPPVDDLRGDAPDLASTPMSFNAHDGGLRLELPDGGFGCVSLTVSPDE
ncbi:MAG: hypothetical protein IPJ65_42080 [Archangiaceae bacterium]|nr:hypothetical protein [Archangiaceae bacterium]